jgi:outer membrane protein insertion porin family
MYNSTDSFISPKKGIFSILSLDFSKGVENSLDNFLKYRFDVRYYYTPWERLTLAVRGRAGHIEPTGSDSIIPEDQLFYLGGVTSVRGFEKNLLRFNEAGKAVGGRQEILANIESRIYMGYNLELTAFFDTGSIGKTFYDEGSGDFRHSAGLGLSYITPLCPIGFVYGHKLDRKEGESSGEFHFSLGFTF